MQKLTLRFFIMLVTFFIGIFTVSIFLFNHACIFGGEFKITPVNFEKKITPIQSNLTSSINEDYAVYSVILNESRYKNKSVIINDYASHGDNAENLNREIAVLTQDTIADYQLKKMENLKLENKFTFNGKLIIISEKEEAIIYRKGWDKPQRNYPKVHGRFNFSRIGFNQAQTQALVSVDTVCGGWCARGSFVVLKKENGKWIVQQTIRTWTS